MEAVNLHLPRIQIISSLYQILHQFNDIRTEPLKNAVMHLINDYYNIVDINTSMAYSYFHIRSKNNLVACSQ